MTLLTTTQAAKPGLGARRLRTLCSQGRISAAVLSLRNMFRNRFFLAL